MIAFYVFLTSLNKLYPYEEHHIDLTQSLSNCSPIDAKVKCKIEQLVLHITCVCVQSSNVFFSQSRLIYLNLYNFPMMWKIITPLFISSFHFLVFSTLNLLWLYNSMIFVDALSFSNGVINCFYKTRQKSHCCKTISQRNSKQ